MGIVGFQIIFEFGIRLHNFGSSLLDQISGLFGTLEFWIPQMVFKFGIKLYNFDGLSLDRMSIHAKRRAAYRSTLCQRII